MHPLKQEEKSEKKCNGAEANKDAVVVQHLHLPRV